MAAAHTHSSIELYKSCPKKYYHLKIAKDVKDSQNQWSIAGDRVHKSLENALKSDAPLTLDTLKYKPIVDTVKRMSEGKEILVERWAAVDENFKACDYKQAYIRGKIDLTIVDSYNRSAVVWDWKTGKVKDDFAQLDTYAMYTFADCQEVDEVRGSYLWLAHGKRTGKVYTRNDLPKIIERLSSDIYVIDKSLKSDNWPAKPSGLCPYCPAKQICKFAKL